MPYLLDENGQVVEIPTGSAPPLGLFDELQIDQGTLHLEPGASLLLYSDGVSEPMDEGGSEFGTAGLAGLLSQNKNLPAPVICERLWQAVQAHGGSTPQQDDFTVVLVKRAHTGKQGAN